MKFNDKYVLEFHPWFDPDPDARYRFGEYATEADAKIAVAQAQKTMPEDTFYLTKLKVVVTNLETFYPLDKK